MHRKNRYNTWSANKAGVRGVRSGTSADPRLLLMLQLARVCRLWPDVLQTHTAFSSHVNVDLERAAARMLNGAGSHSLTVTYQPAAVGAAHAALRTLVVRRAFALDLRNGADEDGAACLKDRDELMCALEHTPRLEHLDVELADVL
ncbi:hypothetical protein PsYK624_148500 [Phanerochaete sordida]|uniref:Uncharacterized protein n=1 Tax=Phanerochaete sordida TaxID=48140 RepID=A0A9P3GP68_9APHY|nr:hypothetical protein PsYK624_148500 [Phanerochaete sordida]